MRELSRVWENGEMLQICKRSRSLPGREDLMKDQSSWIMGNVGSSVFAAWPTLATKSRGISTSFFVFGRSTTLMYTGLYYLYNSLNTNWIQVENWKKIRLYEATLRKGCYCAAGMGWWLKPSLLFHYQSPADQVLYESNWHHGELRTSFLCVCKPKWWVSHFSPVSLGHYSSV